MKNNKKHFEQIEHFLENQLDNIKNKLIMAFITYEYLMKILLTVIFLLIVSLLLILLNKFISIQSISIIISIVSLTISTYFGLRKPKCDIGYNVNISKESGVFVELYSKNSSTCIVNINSMILLDDSSNKIMSFETRKFSKILPNDILKNYILSNKTISVVPLVYIKKPMFDYDVKTYMNLAGDLKQLDKNNEFATLILQFKRSDKPTYFEIKINYNDLINYKY